jgi:hypothetical protein
LFVGFENLLSHSDSSVKISVINCDFLVGQT